MPERTATERLDQIIQFMTDRVERANKTISEFADKLKASANPQHEMKWSREVFEAAPLVSFYTKQLKSLKAARSAVSLADEYVYAAFMVTLNQEVKRGARNPKSSPSVPFNFANQCMLVTVATLLDDIENGLL